MKTIPDKSESPVTRLTVLPAYIRCDYRTLPLEFGNFFKGNPAQLDVPVILFRIELDLHMNYCTHNNFSVKTFSTILGSNREWADSKTKTIIGQPGVEGGPGSLSACPLRAEAISRMCRFQDRISQGEKMIKILLADDHAQVREDVVSEFAEKLLFDLTVSYSAPISAARFRVVDG
jgi:hypothetical protein